MGVVATVTVTRNRKHTKDVFYSYDLRGLMTAARFDSLTGNGVATTYDGFGRINTSTQLMDSNTRTLAFCYDARGNRTRSSFPDSALGTPNTAGSYCGNTWTNHITYSYDGLDRPLTVVDANAVELHRSVYANQGWLAEEWFGNSAWGSSAFTRDPVGRLSNMYRNLFGAAADYTASFELR